MEKSKVGASDPKYRRKNGIFSDFLIFLIKKFYFSTKSWDQGVFSIQNFMADKNIAKKKHEKLIFSVEKTRFDDFSLILWGGGSSFFFFFFISV